VAQVRRTAMVGARGASVSQFVLLTDPFWLRKIITDPHALSQVQCPDDRYPELKICLGTGFSVACWLLVPKFAGSNPAEAVGFLRAKKILSTPSFGGEVKPSVPCRRFVACKRSLMA